MYARHNVLILALLLCSIGGHTFTMGADGPATESIAMKNDFDTPRNLSVIFHPRPAPGETDELDVMLPVTDDVSLGGRLHVAAKDAPLLLFFHGNGEIASDYDDIVPMYASLGLNVLMVDYRGYGRSEGTPTVETLLSDARTVFDTLPTFLDKRALTPGRVYVMGRSLGSATAIEIATHAGNGIAGLIIESGFAYPRQLVERLGGVIDGADSDNGTGPLGALTGIAAVKVPTLIIHGERDWIIPVTDGQALHYHSGAETKTLVQIPGAGHNDLLWRGQQKYFEAIKDFTAK